MKSNFNFIKKYLDKKLKMYLNFDKKYFDTFEPINIFNYKNSELFSNNNNIFDNLDYDYSDQKSIDNKNNFVFFQTNLNLDYEKEFYSSELKPLKYFEVKKELKSKILHSKEESLVDLNLSNETKFNSEKKNRNFIFCNFQSLHNYTNRNIDLLKKSLREGAKKEHKKIKHDKYSNDNVIKKCKHLVLSNIMDFINLKIFSIYKGKIKSKRRFRNQLLPINKSQKSNTNILYNRAFVNKNISDIFSDNITKKYSSYPLEHNKLLIEKLKNQEDKTNSKYFNKLFNLTFSECLNHFIGKKEIEELKGMNLFENVIEILGEDKEYINLIKYYLQNFENIINEKNPRRSKNYKNSISTEEESQQNS